MNQVEKIQDKGAFQEWDEETDELVDGKFQACDEETDEQVEGAFQERDCDITFEELLPVLTML